MKKVMKSMIAILAIGTLLISSCKKGENDPFLSLKSRKSRLVGEWKLTSGTFKETNNSGTFTTTTTKTYTETTMTEVTSSGSTTSTDEYNYTWELSFVKDGTGTQKTVSTQTSANGTAIPTSIQSTTTDDLKLNWSFVGKNKSMDQKRKEGIVIAPTGNTSTTVTPVGTSTSTNTVTGYFPSILDMWMIDQLKNKEIIFKGTYSIASGSSTQTFEYELTFTAK